MKISIICCCMNREQNLKLALKTWIQIKDIHEIILLDYGSIQPIKNIIKDKRIFLYRYEAEYWHLSKAYNIASQLATGDILIKLDADYILQKNFLDKNILTYKSFIQGSKAHDEHLNGLLMLYKKDFLNINGYNENIINYGYDDDDIYHRLIAIGLKSIYVDKNTIFHIPHSNESRKIHNKNAKLTFEESVNQNIFLSQQTDWSKYGVMSEYRS